MRIVSSSFTCPLLRVFGVQGEDRLGIGVLSAWTLEGEPLPVVEMWKRFLRAAPDAVLDQAIPKSASEWLLVGHAHAATPVTEVVVGVETLGGYKALNVVGDRVWRGGVPTAPEPFTKMPLDWSHSFGGQGYPSNPSGRGFVTGDPEGVALPNVELHGAMLTSPTERPVPAGFGAFHLEWPQRMEGLGTYDRKWFEQDFPGFAEDIDWRVHNIAPPDQRVDSPLEPGPRFILHNLVEGRPRVEVALPEVVSRCFVYEDEQEGALEEVALALRTVWLVPDEDMVVLVANGSRPCRSPLMSDLEGVLVGLDWAALPRDIEYWGDTMSTRLDTSDEGVTRSLDEAPFMPEGMRFDSFAQHMEDLSLPERRNFLARNLHEGAKLRRQRVLEAFAEAGFEGGEELFPPLPPPELSSGAPLDERVKGALNYADQQRQATDAMFAQLREEARAELEAAGLDPALLDGGERAGPPPILASAQIELLQDAIREGKEGGLPTEARLNDPGWHREILHMERQGREGYRLSAHYSETSPDLPSDDARAALREDVEAAIRDRTSLSERDLTCADLNELDLSGMDLRGAWLEGAELAKANLSGALLERAVLAKADLSEAVLHQTVLRHANLGRTRLLFTELRDCDLGEATLAHANLRAAAFTGCDLHGLDLSNAWFEKTRFDACNLEGVTLIQTSLKGVEFSGSRLAKANLIEVNLDGVSFHRCDLFQATFVTCKGELVRFDEANMENTRFAVGCELNGADFRGANLSRSTLRGCELEGAHFASADLRCADLSQANCVRANFVKADMRKLLATECLLEEAVLRGANLMEAVLQGADLRGADLAMTNLFGTDLALVRGDDRTTIAQALTTRMRVRPFRKVEPMRELTDE